MTATVVVMIVAFCVGLSGVFLANMFITMMIGEINRRRSDADLLSYFGFTPAKIFRLFSEYRSLYPEGHLHVFALACFACTMVGFIVVAVCLQIGF